MMLDESVWRNAESHEEIEEEGDIADRKPLSVKQAQVYRAIVLFIYYNGYSPSYQEIASLESVDCTAVNTVRSHVDVLVKKGYLSGGKDVARSIVVVDIAEMLTNDIMVNILDRVEIT